MVNVHMHDTIILRPSHGELHQLVHIEPEIEGLHVEQTWLCLEMLLEEGWVITHHDDNGNLVLKLHTN